MRKNLPYFLVCFALAAAAVALFVKLKDSRSPSQSPVSEQADTAYFLPDAASKTAPILQVGKTLSVNYTHSQFGFSLTLPEGLKIGEFEEGEGRVVLLQGSAGGSEDFALQIYVAELDEETVITPQKIQADIPGINMQAVQTVSVGGAEAVAFIDAERDTREVWFVRSQKLYQIISRPKHDAAAGKILQSWRWK